MLEDKSKDSSSFRKNSSNSKEDFPVQHESKSRTGENFMNESTVVNLVILKS